MKKFLYGALALASVASLASCSSDEPLGQQPNDGKVTFTVTMPGQNTRFADGKTVDQLYYTVFQNGTKVLEGVEDWPTGSLSTTVTLQLVSNQSYDVVFFADTKAAETAGVYSYDKASAQFNVTYKDAMINNDAYDAFVKKETIVADGGEKKVLLYRPFAQVNIGTDDLTNGAVDKYGLENFSSTLTIKPTNLLSGMNFFSGATTEQATDVTFTLPNFKTPALPGDPFPVVKPEEEGKVVEPYKYIEMNYLLVPVAPENAAEDWSNLLNVTYTINGKGENNVVNELNLNSMPTRQNYQTNIYGSLLTTQQAFNIEIKPAFITPGFNNQIVMTPKDLIGSLTDPNVKDIIIGGNIDLSELLGGATPVKGKNTTRANGEIVLQGEKVITMYPGVIVTLPTNTYLSSSYSLTIEGGTLTNEIAEGQEYVPDSYGAIGLVRVSGGTLTLKNTKLVNAMNYHYHGTTTNNSAAVSYSGTANVIIENSNIQSGMFAVCGMRDNTTGTITLKNSTFESNSSSGYGTNSWAYCLRLTGGTGSATNCTVKGIQGGLSTELIKNFQINSGCYYTVNNPGKTDAFYAVYVTNASSVVINGGYFYGANAHNTLAKGKSCVVSGDNDTNKPVGSITINGGYFNGIAYNHVTGETYGTYKDVNVDYEGMNFIYEGEKE